MIGPTSLREAGFIAGERLLGPPARAPPRSLQRLPARRTHSSSRSKFPFQARGAADARGDSTARTPFAMDRLNRLLAPLLLALLAAFAAAAPTSLPACLKDAPAFHPGSPEYVRLSGLGLVNNTATPSAIVLATSAAHVQLAVRCAAAAGVGVCARSGGHSFTGQSLCAGVLVDVGPMRSVSVMPNGVAWIQAGAVMGEILWAAWQKGRWVPAGVCPSVGVGGFVFGGGHNPYEATLGLACDSLMDVTLVGRDGSLIVASKTSHADLYWGLCGAGGGQFGIVTSFRMKTVPRKRYDRSVIFRFTWQKEHVGKMIDKWTRYKEEGGDVWFRLTVNANMGPGAGIIAVGACFDVDKPSECLNRLKKAPHFNVPGRKQELLFKPKDALHLHAFFGPGGSWSRAPVKDVRFGLLEQRYVEAGFGNGRTYQSTFLTFNGTSRPTPEYWQIYAEKCANSGFKSVPWAMCEMNLFNGKIRQPVDNAYAHRQANVVTHYVVGGGTQAALDGAYARLRDHLKPWTSGVYVNYAEKQLGDQYPSLYWGRSLPRLQQLKKAYDPHTFFENPQPIPQPLLGSEGCAGR